MLAQEATEGSCTVAAEELLPETRAIEADNH